MSSKPYTDDKCRIILSFANGGGGDLFAHWLRDKLMKELNYYSENAVYLDNIASRNAPGGQVAPDLRFVEGFEPSTGLTADGSYVPIGAQNKNWLEMWQKALSQAQVVIQIQTPEFNASTPCAQENARINKELKKGKNKLEVLAITVDFTCPKMTIDQPRTTPMQLTKIPGDRDQDSLVKKLKGSWVVSPTDLNWVFDFVKEHGCRVGA